MAAQLAIVAKLEDHASGGVRALRGEIEGLGDSGSVAAKGFSALQTVGTAALTALAVAAVAVGTAITSSIGAASEFQDKITILAIAAKGAGESFDGMSDAAMRVGADTSLVGVNAAQAAEAMTTLYKAGLTTGEIFGDLNGYLAGNVELSGALRAAIDGAAASELDMAQAAELAAITLATFGSELTTTEQRAEFVNIAMNNFVQAADASLASVGDLAAAMSTIGPTAAQFGISLQDTNTALAILSTRGISGSEAGTALKSMLVNLMRTTPDVTSALDALGVSLYNADGTMRQLPQIVSDLSQALYGFNETTVITGGRTAEQNRQLDLARQSYTQATDAIYKHNAGLKILTDSQLTKYVEQQTAANAEIQRLGAITGEATTAVSQLTEEQRNQYIVTLAGSYGMKAMAALLMEGTDGWTAMEKAIAAAATIQEVAAARTATFSGAMEALSGVVETIRIGIGSAFLPMLTMLAKALANLASDALPQIVGMFEAVGGALASFFENLQSGMSIWGALKSSLMDIGQAFGMTADQSIGFAAGITNVIQAITNVLGPIVQAITSFVSWKDVLLALAIAIASVVIPALVWIIQAVAPVVLVFGGLTLAIAALRTAFETNFLGIRDLALSLWDAIKGAFEGIRALLSGDTTAAMAAFRSAWETGWNAIIGFVQNAGAQIGQALAGLWQSIQNWFASVDWAGLGRSLVDKFMGALAALGQARADLWSWILTSITNFINNTNWSQIGYTVVDLLGKAIAGAVGLIATAVEGIVTFIREFLTGADWQEIGRNLVKAIVDGLGSFADGAGRKLGEWRDVIFDWAGAEDWRGVAEIIIEMVGEALADAADAIGERLSSWREAIFDWAGAEDWGGVAETIVEMVGEALADAADAIGERVSAWYDAIVNWVQSIDWESIGLSIVNFILEGLSEFVSNVADAISDWWNAVERAIESVDWYQLGYDIAFYVIDGLAEFVNEVVDTVTYWYKAFERATVGLTWEQIAGLIIVAIVDGLVDFAKYAYEVVKGWYDSISTAFWGLVGSFFELGKNIVGGIISGIKAMIGAVGDAIRGIIDAALAAGRQQAGAQSPATAFMPLGRDMGDGVAVGVIQSTGTIIRAMQQVASEAELAGAKAFADAMKGIGEAIATAIQSYIMLGGFGELDTNNASSGLASITTLMKTMVDSFVEANTYTADVLSLAEDFADLAGEIVELMADSLLPLRTLAAIDTSFLQSTQLATGLLSLRDFLATLVAVFLETSLEFAYMSDAVEAFTDAAEAVVGLVEDALGAAVMLFMFNFSAIQSGNQNLSWQIAALSDILREMVAGFVEASLEFAYLSEAVEAFADAAGAVVDLVEDALGTAVTLFTFNFSAIQAGNQNLSWQIAALAAILREIVAGFVEASLEFAYLSDAVEAFADAAGAVVDLIGPAIEALSLLVNFKPVSGLQASATAFAQQLTDVLITIAGIFGWAAAQAVVVISLATSFAENAKTILSVIEPGLESLKALAEFKAIAGIKASATSFAIQLTDVLITIAGIFGWAAAQAVVVITLAASFAENAKAILDVVEPGLESLKALAEFEAIAGIRTNATAFAQQLTAVLVVIAQAFANASAEAKAALVAAGAFAQSAREVLDVVAPGVEALAAIGSYIADKDLKGKATQFTTDLMLVMMTLAAGLAKAAQAAGETVTHAVTMANALVQVLDVVKPGIDALAALGEYTAASGIGAKTAKFVADLTKMVVVLVTGLTEAASLIGQKAIAAAIAFATAVTGIVTEVRSATTTLVELAAMAMPDIQPQLNYLTTSAAQINTSFTAAGNIGAAVAFAAAFRANLEQLVAEVAQAVARLAQLAGTGTSGSVSAALNRISAALENTQGQFAGAGTALATAFGNALVTTITAGASTAAAATRAVLNAAIAAGTAAAAGGRAIGQALITAIIQGVQGGQGALIAAVLAVINAAVAAGQNAARGAAAIGASLVQAAASGLQSGQSSLASAGSAAGSAMIDGMVNAITGGRSRLVNAVSAATSAVVTAAKTSLGIASPSKVAFDLMQNFMNTAAGVLADPRGLVRAVDQSMSRMVDVAGQSLSGAQLSGSTSSFASPGLTGTWPGAGSPAMGFGGTAGDVTVTININGGDHSLTDIKRQVQQAVSDALVQQGRRADATRRMR